MIQDSGRNVLRLRHCKYSESSSVRRAVILIRLQLEWFICRSGFHTWIVGTGGYSLGWNCAPRFCLSRLYICLWTVCKEC